MQTRASVYHWNMELMDSLSSALLDLSMRAGIDPGIIAAETLGQPAGVGDLGPSLFQLLADVDMSEKETSESPHVCESMAYGTDVEEGELLEFQGIDIDEPHC